MSLIRQVRGIYPGWWLAGGSCVSLGLVAGMSFWAFGLYLDPLHDDLGWSKSAVSAGVSLTFLVSGIASPIVGRLVSRYGPKIVIAVGTVGTACVYLGMSRMESLWQFFLLLCVLAFFRTFIFYIPFTTMVTRWFNRRRAGAMGIATSGFGFGGLVFLPLMALLVSVAGWRDSLIAAALMTLGINGLFLLLATNEPGVSNDQSYSQASATTADDRPIAIVRSTGEMLRNPFFWLLATGFSLFFFAQWAFLFHAIPYFEDKGFSAGKAAAVLSCAAGLGVFLRLSGGFLLDRVRSYEWLAVGVLLTMATALFILILGPSSLVLIAFVLMWGVGSGIGPLLEPMLIAKTFGRERYAAVYGWVDGADTTVAVAGPWLGTLILQATGGYDGVLGLYAIALLVSSGAFATLALLKSRTVLVSRPIRSTTAETVS